MDPDVQVAVFKAAPIPTIEEDIDRVVEYVLAKAEEVDAKIPSNRGVPRGANPSRMLNRDEKCVVILGRALGATNREIIQRINEYRVHTGGLLFDGDRNVSHFASRNEVLVKAIQADLLSAMEALAPLVRGSNRMLFRARMLEFYRQEFLGKVSDFSGAKTVKAKRRLMREIQSLDRAMRPHMDYFDKAIKTNVSELLGSPSKNISDEVERLRGELSKKVEAGEMDEFEMARKLRENIHGPAET